MALSMRGTDEQCFFPLSGELFTLIVAHMYFHDVAKAGIDKIEEIYALITVHFDVA